jgi:hypothetical protein
MKRKIVSAFLMVVISCSLLSQPNNHSLISPEMLHQQTRLRITDNNQGPSERSAAIGSFSLRQQELKAVAIVDTAVTKLERSFYPILLDTATRSGLFMLPELYFAKEVRTNNQIMYRIIYVDSAPLRFNFGTQEFKGGIRFLAVETSYSKESPPTQKNLSAPEEIVVSYGLDAMSLKISQINWPPMDAIITTPSPMDSIEVKILTISNPQGYTKYLPVEPAIVLSSSRTKIQGFGLQTMLVAVALKGVTSYKPVPLTVQSSTGTIKNPDLVLTNSNPDDVLLRSESYGKIDIGVANTTYISNSISVTAIFPWLFLILAILGGLIGGIGKKLKGKGKVTLRVVVFSCIIGLIVAAVYYGLGINLLNFSFEDRGYNEAIVFGLGLLAGYFGIK